MKTIKKVVAVALALCMCFALCCTAFAASTGVDDEGNLTGTLGSIEIEGAAAGEVYSIYQIFELTYSDEEPLSYSYKLVDDWYGFFENYPYWDQYFTLIEVGGNDYSISGQYDEGAEYYLDPNSLIFSEDCDIDLAEFAKAALDYAEKHGIEPTDSQRAASDAFWVGEDGEEIVVTFTDLALGWYLVDSSLGTLCMLTSTDPDAVINEKNPEPTVDKYVSDPFFGESTDDELTSDDADNDDYLEYKLVIHDVGNVSNLVIHDYLDDQLDLDSLVVTSVILYSSADDTMGTVLHEDSVGDGGFFVDVEGFTLTVTNGTCSNPDCGLESCSFEISISDDLLAGLSTDAYIVITYDVLIDENIQDFDENLVDEIDNFAALTYGTASHSEIVETETYSFGFEIFKYTKNDSDVLAVTVTEGGYYVVGCHDVSENSQRYYKDEYDIRGNTIYATEGANDYAAIRMGTVLNLDPGTYYFVGLQTNDYAEQTDFELIPVTLNSSDGSAGAVDNTRETLTLQEQLPLSGAEFVLSKDYTDENGATTTYYGIFEFEAEIVDEDTGEVVVHDGYLLIDWTTDIDKATHLVSESDGMIYVEGLHDGNYTLTEVKAPDGYNLLADSIVINISNNGTVSLVVEDDDDIVLGDKVVEVINNAGTELPGTGGMGVYIFYIVGGCLVVAAAVVLITRRRMTR